MHSVLTMRVAAIIVFLLFGLAVPREALAQFNGCAPGFCPPYAGGGGTTQTQYYVSNSGSNSNPGTIGSPWQTCAAINGFSFPSNSTIYFNGGQTFTSCNMVFGSGGASHSGTLTITSYGSGDAMLNAGAADAIDIVNDGNYVIENLVLVGSGGTATNGIYLNNNQAGNTQFSNVTLTGLTISGFTGRCVLVGGNNGTSGFTNISFINSIAHDCIISGFQAYGSVNGANPAHHSITVTGNTVYNIPGTMSVENSGIVLGQVDTGLVSLNVCYDNGASAGTNNPICIWAYDSNNLIYTYNEAYGSMNATGGFDFDEGVTNSTLAYNYSHGNSGPGFQTYAAIDGLTTTWSGNSIHHNISQNDSTGGAYGGFRIGNDGTAVMSGNWFNNTVYNTSGRPCFAVGDFISAANITGYVANNILYCDSTSKQIESTMTPASTLKFVTNDYYGSSGFQITWGGTSYTTLGAWQGATSQDPSGLTSNPDLSSAGAGGTCGGWSSSCPGQYELTTGSPMIDTGLNLTGSPYLIAVGTHDYYNNTIPNGGGGTGYNVGAYGATVASGCSAATAWLARTSGLSTTETNAYTAMICGMILDGNGCAAWSGSTGTMDVLYIFATNNTTTANLNLCGTGNTLTQSGTVTFLADNYYQGDGSTGYLDTGLTLPSTHLTQNSQSLGTYVLNNRTGTSLSYCEMGQTDGIYIAPNNNASGYQQSLLQLSGNAASGQTSAQGAWIASRTASNVVAGYKNGSSTPILTGTDASVSFMTSNSIYIAACRFGAGNTASNWSADQIAATFVGGALTATQAVAINNRINAYMTALGINLY
jgi:hypothetical protein